MKILLVNPPRCDLNIPRLDLVLLANRFPVALLFYLNYLDLTNGSTFFDRFSFARERLQLASSLGIELFPRCEDTLRNEPFMLRHLPKAGVSLPLYDEYPPPVLNRQRSLVINNVASGSG